MKFRKKPVIVDGEQFLPDQRPWPAGVQPVYTHPAYPAREEPKGYTLDTLEGRAYNVMPGDWIMTGVKGERWPIKDEILRETYDVVSD